jgi:flagellar biogenesis protein FliO
MTQEALALQASPIITAGYVMQVMFSLAVVVALIVVIARYLMPRLNITTGGSKIVQIVDRVMLEPQVGAYVIKVKNKAWLVVASNKSVAPIGEVEV